jgi:hypothetical protein
VIEERLSAIKAEIEGIFRVIKEISRMSHQEVNSAQSCFFTHHLIAVNAIVLICTRVGAVSAPKIARFRDTQNEMAHYLWIDAR